MTIYRDRGNEFVARNVPTGCKRLLDVGCGSGDTAWLIRSSRPSICIHGITANPNEAAAASGRIDKVFEFDLEDEHYPDLDRDYDCLLFSHVLEHVREPWLTLSRFLEFLTVDGHVVIALPNVLEWRTRAALLLGRWNYTDGGILDRTHLRFFTYESALSEIIRAGLDERLEIEAYLGHGAVPLWRMRAALPAGAVKLVDQLGVRLAPNLFARQVLIVARKAR